MDLHRIFLPVPLDGLELRIYRYAVDTESFRASVLTDLFGVTQQEVDEAVGLLGDLGLLRDDGSGTGRLTAVSPDRAGPRLVEPALRYAAEIRTAAQRLEDEFRLLSELYRSGTAHRLRREDVEIVPKLADVRARLEELAAGAREEILTSQPGGARPEEVLEEAAGRTERVLRRGVAMRTIYQYTAQFSLGTFGFAERLAGLGAEVRMLGDAFPRLIVFDRETAVLGVAGNPGAAALVSDPSTVAFAVDAFERAWTQAVAFPRSVGREQAVAASDAVKADVIQLLISGQDDKVIARRMGMSVRTCQRHIAEIMARVGARNRVQAGFLLYAAQQEDFSRSFTRGRAARPDPDPAAAPRSSEAVGAH